VPAKLTPHHAQLPAHDGAVRQDVAADNFGLKNSGQQIRFLFHVARFLSEEEKGIRRFRRLTQMNSSKCMLRAEHELLIDMPTFASSLSALLSVKIFASRADFLSRKHDMMKTQRRTPLGTLSFVSCSRSIVLS